MLSPRPFGKNHPLVSGLGLGLAALGRPGYINLGHATDLAQDYAVAAMEARTHEVLDAAWAAGVRYFDMARSYGRAEAFFGSWVRKRGFQPGELTVGSKWGYTYTAGWQVEAEKHEVKSHTLPVFARQWQETQAEIGPWLDLYQIHSATLESGVLENRAVLAAIAQLKENGIRLGLSLSGPQQALTLAKALEVEIDGEPLFSAVQATWNLLEPSAGPRLAEAHAAGWAVIIKEGVANGRLTPRNDAPAFAAQRTRLEAQARRLHTSLDALALAAVLAQPWVDVVLSGAATTDHLHSNLAAAQVAWDDAAATALTGLAEPPETYWQIRSELAWN